MTSRRIKSISQYHQMMGLPAPQHPLVSLIHFDSIKCLPCAENLTLLIDFYSVALKKNFNARLKYGQLEYDFDEGMLAFMSPGQILRIDRRQDVALQASGCLLLIHPDFLWNTPLAKHIKKYEYFSYSVKEALFLSAKEEATLTAIMGNIAQEYHANLDQYSQGIIIAQLELLFSYAQRFYNRQFITRKIANHKILDQLEGMLSDYFNGEDLIHKGLPSVQAVAASLNVSPNYLSNLLTALTGQSTQQHIHDKLIEKAKEKLSVTDLSVSEIAYALGFEHPQSFSKLFKTKTRLSPSEFRQSFN